MSSAASIAFAGTPEFAVPALRALHASGHSIPWVLTQPDRPAGRGRRIEAPAVKRVALSLGLEVRQPSSLAEVREAMAREPAPELIVVVAYGLLLPRWLLDWPRLGCVNLHASLLPRWRGAAPIQHALLAGDPQTGVSVMKLIPKLDAGPVYRQAAVSIGRRETAGELHDRLACLAADLLTDTLPGILDESLPATPQDDRQATYAPKIDKTAARIDWSEAAQALERRVRAFNPWPVCEAFLSDGRRIRIWEAEPVPGPVRDAPPGTIVRADAQGIDVATGRGALRLLTVQPPSGKVMAARDYLNAHSLDGVHFVR